MCDGGRRRRRRRDGLIDGLLLLRVVCIKTYLGSGCLCVDVGWVGVSICVLVRLCDGSGSGRSE